MGGFQATADLGEIEVLRGEFTDTAVMRDCDRLTSLFTHTEATVTAPRTGRRPIRHHPHPTTATPTTSPGGTMTPLPLKRSGPSPGSMGRRG